MANTSFSPQNWNAVPGPRWTGIHRPSAGTQASVTIAAPGAGQVLVCESLTVTYIAGASAPTAATHQVSLISGASGGTTYLWGTTLAVPAVAGAPSGACVQGPWVGANNGALTLEFDAGGGANTLESVTCSGWVQTL